LRYAKVQISTGACHFPFAGVETTRKHNAN
jgi:hypothetical protein